MPNYWETPYKLGKPVLTGSGVAGAFDERAVDGPTVFYHRGQWHMMYIGFDGVGYQTALAVSDDLLHWTHKAVILPRPGGKRWDAVGRAGTSLLRETYDLYEKPTLKKREGKYWLMYHSYPGEGYETGPAEIGLAWSEDEQLLVWHALDTPVFSWRDGDAWDRGGLYKCSLFEQDGLFYIFYNAKDKDASGWVEQTGMATSPDLIHWTRCALNPVLPVEPGSWRSKFCSDPIVFRADGRYVMFFFGFNYSHAQDGVAFSDDLMHWQALPEPIIRYGGGEEIDTIHAHKPGIVWHDGVLYHFYCACRPWREGDVAQNGNEFRCITLAASKPIWSK